MIAVKQMGVKSLVKHKGFAPFLLRKIMAFMVELFLKILFFSNI